MRRSSAFSHAFSACSSLSFSFPSPLWCSVCINVRGVHNTHCTAMCARRTVYLVVQSFAIPSNLRQGERWPFERFFFNWPQLPYHMFKQGNIWAVQCACKQKISQYTNTQHTSSQLLGQSASPENCKMHAISEVDGAAYSQSASRATKSVNIV